MAVEAAFLASDPKTKEASFGWAHEECTPKLYPSAKGEYLKDLVAEMEYKSANGIGISTADQERIFHEFVQLGKTQLQNGTGLGLPISRRLAELLQGSLTVESIVGTGSTFRLELPATAEGRGLRLVDQELAREPADDRVRPRDGEEGVEQVPEWRVASTHTSVSG